MIASLYNSVSGMQSSQFGIDVWAHNISNVNTVGYKADIPEFSSIFSNSLNKDNPVVSNLGFGAKAASSAISMKEGSIIESDDTFDMALSGKGWFKVLGSNGEDFFTRKGTFNKDKDGFLVNDNGNKLEVVSANNVMKNGDNFVINPSVNTDNLVTSKNEPTSSIQVPDNMVYPPSKTTFVKLQANLQNSDQITNSTPAIEDSNFNALYSNGNNLNITNGDDFIYTLTPDINYNNGVLEKEECIYDDKLDGQDVNIDFNVNGTDIKLTLPDGSSKSDISNAIVNELKKNNIDAEVSDNGIIFKNPDKLLIKSNDNIISNVAAMRLEYNNNPTEDNQFTTIQNVKSKIKSMIDLMGYDATVSLDNGSIKVTNNSTSNIYSDVFAGKNNNPDLENSFELLGNTILGNSSVSSEKFENLIQSFSTKIVDSNGNQNDVKMDFIKSDVNNLGTIWKSNINVYDQNGNLLNSNTTNVSFNKDGFLLDPKTISFNNGSTTLDISKLSSFNTTKQTATLINKDGSLQGNLFKYDIDETGKIIASFDNGKSAVIAQIPVYHFINDQGLESVGGDLFRPTVNSGDSELIVKNGEYYSMSKVLSNKIEMSNVSMSQAMTEMIVMQKAFSANAKGITTSDQMIQKAIDMKR